MDNEARRRGAAPVDTIPLLGYSDRLSVRPGETISFKVSSFARKPFSARLLRSICADPNPDGPGMNEQDASAFFPETAVPSREQTFSPGSYGLTLEPLDAAPAGDVVLSAVIWPTRECPRNQTVIAVGDIRLCVDDSVATALHVGDASVSAGTPMRLRQWYRIEARIAAGGEISVVQHPLGYHFEEPASAVMEARVRPVLSGRASVAARFDGAVATDHFNGKIEDPEIRVDGALLASWDFSRDIPSTTVTARAGPDLALVNFPARGVTGSAWDGSEMCWRHRPAHYAAIHFHEDDIYDFGWQTDFAFTVPDGMPCGVYVMRISCDGNEDAMPFFVCAPPGRPAAKLCVLVSTFTYTLYGNHARREFEPGWRERMHDWNACPYNPADHAHYGLSTYNNHTDGSGICIASYLRPLFNLRPGYITFGNSDCSGLRHFQADSHLISWLHAKGIDYDIVTDMELQKDGAAAIEGYAAVTTGTHPEYHTEKTLNALRDYRDGGGNLLYLGGNGFYWRIAQHCENEGVFEIRRAEDGIRAWEAQPGEYYHAFDGTYGGLWRRNGRPPQRLVGVGFAAQGDFSGSPYRRVCHDPEFDWVFAGMEGELIGDFGYSGNGAAGFELDRLDEGLGSFENLTLLARSVRPADTFVLVPEERLSPAASRHAGSGSDILAADMVYFSVPGGGSVFSTGSITFCGSLPWNGYDNNVSRLLENVLSRFLSPDR